MYYFALKCNGDFDKIYSSLRMKEKFDINEFMKLKKDIQCQYLLDEKYPNYLKEVNKSLVLFLDIVLRSLILIISILGFVS